MKLSDAIALGRTLITAEPHTFWNSSRNSGCALGMGLLAVGNKGILDQGGQHFNLPCEWHWLGNFMNLPCSCGTPHINVAQCITHLFDSHVFGKKDWTLDQLIDWVRSIEPEEKKEVEESGQEQVEQLPLLV